MTTSSTDRPWGDLPLTTLIHENFSIIMAYAFSRPTLATWVEEHFPAARLLHKSVFGMAEQRANVALLEFATQIRLLDDYEPLPELYMSWTFGKYVKGGNTTEQTLSLREMTNKIMHAKTIQWNFTDSDCPIIVCQPHPRHIKRWDWVKAEINLIDLANYCASLML